MSYYVKGLVQKEYEKQFADVQDFLVMNLSGLSGQDNNAIRGELKEKGIRLRMVRNAMMQRALESLSRKPAASLFAGGTCTVAFGGDSLVDVAKEIEAYSKKYKAIQFRGAFVEETVLDEEGAKALAKMPNRAELQGQVVQLAISPGARLASAVLSGGSNIAGCLKSLIEKLEKEAA
jgi:large subunit ribosomal protein L10